jgi:outer membrane lipoprotein SlyB
MRRFAWVAAVLAPLFGIAQAVAQGATDDCDNCGRIVSIRTIADQTTSWTPLGTVAPGAIGGDPSQVGRTTTTFQIGRGLKDEGVVMLGAAGGAAYAKRPQAYQKTRWEIVVKMDDGSSRTVSVEYEPLLQEGDRVRVYGRQLELYQP